MIMICKFSDVMNTAVIVSSIYEINFADKYIFLKRVENEKPLVSMLRYENEQACLRDYTKAIKQWSEYVEIAAFGEDSEPMGFVAPPNGTAQEEEYEDELDTEDCSGRIGYANRIGFRTDS